MPFHGGTGLIRSSDGNQVIFRQVENLACLHSDGLLQHRVPLQRKFSQLLALAVGVVGCLASALSAAAQDIDVGIAAGIGIDSSPLGNRPVLLKGGPPDDDVVVDLRVSYGICRTQEGGPLRGELVLHRLVRV